MEKDKGGRIIALAALLIAVLGLSLGFAAYSSTLTINSNADVLLDEDVWEVGFSTVNSAITAGDKAETGSGTSEITISQFAITQKTPAQLHTTNGSSVTYDFFIVNDGKLDAYLNSVSMGTLSCTYLTGTRTEDNGSTTVTNTGTGTITPADCATMFTATLTIGSTSYTSGQAAVTSGFGTTNMIPATGTKYIAASLTIAYNTDSISSVTNVPDADFNVALSTTSVVYGTNQVS